MLNQKWIVALVILVALLLAVSSCKKSPMTIQVYDPCDIDHDKDCDDDDFSLFQRFLGECEDSNNYNEIADADHDGCVTDTDQKILFPSK